VTAVVAVIEVDRSDKSDRKAQKLHTLVRAGAREEGTVEARAAATDQGSTDSICSVVEQQYSCGSHIARQEVPHGNDNHRGGVAIA
jgi:hypothetical protein